MSENNEGLRRRGKGNNNKTMDNNNRKSGRFETTAHGHADDDDADLDRPLVGGGSNSNGGGGRVRMIHDSDDDAEEGAAISSSSPTNNNNSNNRGTLTTTNNQSWNRLSCVSGMFVACTASGKDDSTKGPVYHTAVDVACTIIDKLPDFFASKFGPNTNKLTDKQRRFVDGFRSAFVTPYNKHDALHVAIAKDLYRRFYSICCVDADPLLDMSDYLEAMGDDKSLLAKTSSASAGGNDDAAENVSSASASEGFGKDPISSEFWKMIGFQGVDPGTDFRGGGVMSLLLLLHLFKNRPDLIRSIFRTREKAPNIAPPPKTSSSPKVGEDPDFHFAPPFFVEEMGSYISSSQSQSTQTAGGEQFLTCEYPFAIAAINVAMHLMLLLGVETKTTCLATTENIDSYSARLARAKVINIAVNDNGNCTSHEEPANSCRAFLSRLVSDYKGHKGPDAGSFASASSAPFGNAASSASAFSSGGSASLVDGFDHFAAIFEMAITVMHNEWCILPPQDKSILFFNQVLQRAREKTEVLLRHNDNLMQLGKAVSNYEWVEF